MKERAKLLLDKALVLKKDSNELSIKRSDICNKIEEYEKQYFDGNTYDDYIDNFVLEQTELNGVKLDYCVGMLSGEITLDKGNKINVITPIRTSKDVYIKKYIGPSGRVYENIPPKYNDVCDDIIAVLKTLKISNPGEELRKMLV